MNRAKIKGNSFIKETKKGKKERMEERKKEKKKEKIFRQLKYSKEIRSLFAFGFRGFKTLIFLC